MLGDSFSHKRPSTNIIKTVKPNITLIPDFWGVNIYLTQILTEKPLVLILKVGLLKYLSMINDKGCKYNSWHS